MNQEVIHKDLHEQEKLFSSTREDLLRYLSYIVPVTKNTGPGGIEYIKIQCNDIVILTATDLRLTISVVSNIRCHRSIEFAISANVISDVIKKLSNNADIHVYLYENNLIIVSQDTKFVILILPVNNFPVLSKISSDNVSISINRLHLIQLISNTMFSAAQDAFREYLNTLHLIIKNDIIRSVSTDGHRLATKNTLCKSHNEDDIAILLSRKSANEIHRLASSINTETINCYIDRYMMYIKLDQLEITSRLINGRFPDYNSVIPQDRQCIFSTRAKTLNIIIDRIALISQDNLRLIRISTTKQKITFTSLDSESGSAIETLQVDCASDEMNMVFNAKYLTDALNKINGEARFEFSGNQSPLVISDASDESVLFLIMPMKL